MKWWVVTAAGVEVLGYPLSLEFWQEWWWAVIVSSLYLGGGRRLLIENLDLHDKPKRKAYTFSVLSSGLLTVTSIPLGLHFLYYWLATNYTLAEKYLARNTQYSGFMMVSFLNFLIHDTINGVFGDKEHFGLLTGWIHHIMYYIAVCISLKFKVATALAVMFMEELPTLILGIGIIKPQYKTEWGFGTSFLFTRVILHSISILFCLRDPKWRAGTVMANITLLLHLFWFSGWIERQYRLTKEKNSNRDDHKNDDHHHLVSHSHTMQEHNNQQQTDAHAVPPFEDRTNDGPHQSTVAAAHHLQIVEEQTQGTGSRTGAQKRSQSPPRSDDSLDPLLERQYSANNQYTTQ